MIYNNKLNHTLKLQTNLYITVSVTLFQMTTDFVSQENLLHMIQIFVLLKELSSSDSYSYIV